MSLDPAAPAILTGPFQRGWTLVEQYGWWLLIAVALFYILRSQLEQFAERRRRQTPIDPQHAEEVLVRVREARLQQQAAWLASAPSQHRATRQQSEEEKRLQRVYGEPKHQDEDDSTMTMDEAFGSEFYRGIKKRKGAAGGSDSSSSSSSSAPTSGFKPYIKPDSSAGSGGRRFGGGGPKRGG